MVCCTARLVQLFFSGIAWGSLSKEAQCQNYSQFVAMNKEDYNHNRVLKSLAARILRIQLQKLIPRKQFQDFMAITLTGLIVLNFKMCPLTQKLSNKTVSVSGTIMNIKRKYLKMSSFSKDVGAQNCFKSTKAWRTFRIFFNFFSRSGAGERGRRPRRRPGGPV